jgi:hypothetical protein
MWVFGKVGRACLQPLFQHDTLRLSRAAAASLRYLIDIIPQIPSFDIALLASREPPSLVFTDGCAEDGSATMAVGYIVGIPKPRKRQRSSSSSAADEDPRRLEDYIWYHGGGDLPGELRSAFVERRQQIGQVEIVGALTPYLSLPHLLAGRDVIHWIDNTSAMAALCKGYSRMPDSARLVHAFHAWNAGAQARVWFEYVPSAANPSDEPSRVEGLWQAPFKPAAGVDSRPMPCRFPPLSGISDPGAWIAEAVAVSS